MAVFWPRPGKFQTKPRHIDCDLIGVVGDGGDGLIALNSDLIITALQENTRNYCLHLTYIYNITNLCSAELIACC